MLFFYPHWSGWLELNAQKQKKNLLRMKKIGNGKCVMSSSACFPITGHIKAPTSWFGSFNVRSHSFIKLRNAKYMHKNTSYDIKLRVDFFIFLAYKTPHLMLYLGTWRSDNSVKMEYFLIHMDEFHFFTKCTKKLIYDIIQNVPKTTYMKSWQR